MRVSDRTTIRNYLNYLDQAKTNYAETNERIASGNRFERISDDVSAGTRVLRVRTDMKKTEEYYDTVHAINEELTVTENAMTAINDLLTKAHTKILKALNDPTGSSGREAIANEISAIKKEMLQCANTKYNNKYVLAGSSASVAPFSLDLNGKLRYNNIDVDIIKYTTTDGYYWEDGSGTKHSIPMDKDIYADIGLGIRMTGSDIQSDTAFKVSYSGLEILGCGEDSNGDPKNLYSLLSKIEDAMRGGNLDKLGSLDSILVKSTEEFSKFITDVGSKTNFLDGVETRLTSRIDSYQKQIGTLMGIDDAKEAMNQTMNDYVLKAVLQMGANILPVSLMDFLD